MIEEKRSIVVKKSHNCRTDAPSPSGDKEGRGNNVREEHEGQKSAL